MIQTDGKLLQRWIVPAGAATVLFLSLLFLIPYAAGYGTHIVPLGILLWNVCMAGQNSRVTLDFSYCLFVPVIVAYLVFMVRKNLEGVALRGENSGLIWMAVGLFFYWLGLRAQMQVAGYAGLQLLLAGMIIWLWGGQVFRKLLFPWAFFAFFWPLPFLDSTVAFPLRMIMSHMAFDILNIVGIPAIQNGTAIVSAPDPLSGLKLGDRFRIDIADPCSGIRSLLALMMISALYAHIALPKLWQQWIIFLSSIPLTIIGNLARVLILIGGSILFGSAFAVGTYEDPSWFHEGAGFMVYGVALGLEFGLGLLLTRNWKRHSKSEGHAPLSTTESGSPV